MSFLDICSASGLRNMCTKPPHPGGHGFNVARSDNILVVDLDVCPTIPSQRYYFVFIPKYGFVYKAH